MDFFNQPEDFGLQGVEGNHIVKGNVLSAFLRFLHQIDIIRGFYGQFCIKRGADPENEPPVWNLRVVNDGLMGNTRRNQHHIARFQRIFRAIDADGHISFQKKIELVIIVGVFFDLTAGPVLTGIIVIINFKIL